MKTGMQAFALLASTAAAATTTTTYKYGAAAGQSAVAKGHVTYGVTYTTAENYEFYVNHKFEFIGDNKFKGKDGEYAEMFSCFFPSECIVHRVTPNADLTDYITDTEVYEAPKSVKKPYDGWYTATNARFSTSAVANQWTVTYASTTFDHT